MPDDRGGASLSSRPDPGCYLRAALYRHGNRLMMGRDVHPGHPFPSSESVGGPCCYTAADELCAATRSKMLLAFAREGSLSVLGHNMMSWQEAARHKAGTRQ